MFKMMIAMAATKLREYLSKNNGIFEIGEEAVNLWLKENAHPFILKFDVEKKEFIIKLIKADS